MKIAIISGSRADRGGLTAVKDQLDKYMAHDVHELSDISAIRKWGYDLAVILGDRSEILRAAVELYCNGIPIAHLSGGDVTEGSADECMRHAITKLSHLHFTTNERSAQRVIQLGEEPWRVHNVGYPGEDNLETVELETALRVARVFNHKGDFLLVVWHPNTVSPADNYIEILNLINSLDRVFEKTIVIGSNLDDGYELVNKELSGWCTRTYNTFIKELPRDIYLTLLKHCACLVGNSSSGYYEAPLFGTPTVDIGDRQLGRERPNCMISVPSRVQDIVLAIRHQLKVEKRYPPKTGSEAARKIAEVISSIKDPQALRRKKFYDLQPASKGLG